MIGHVGIDALVPGGGNGVAAGQRTAGGRAVVWPFAAGQVTVTVPSFFNSISKLTGNSVAGDPFPKVTACQRKMIRLVSGVTT